MLGPPRTTTPASIGRCERDMIRHLFSFPGGVTLRQHKKDSTMADVERAPLPARLILPLSQHIGHPAKVAVAVGDKVGKHQILARSVDHVSAPVHAPTSGKILAITDHGVPHPSGLKALCIILEADDLDQDRRAEKRHRDYRDSTPAQLRDMIRDAGVVGLGGAGFPSHVKLNSNKKRVETLILNGAECEPFITCDEMLMRKQAVEIVEGLIIMRHALHAKHCIIAIENTKRLAIESMEHAVLQADMDFIELVTIPTVYPTGGEKQLLQVLTGKEVPSQCIPLDINLVCHNVSTAYAVCRAVEHGEPLVSRYITLAGNVAKARNLEVLIGTPIHDLVTHVGVDPRTLKKVIVGGPMMGFAINDVDIPVIKTTNCLLLTSLVSDVLLPIRSESAMPCIRCGACAQACPIGLLPQQLYWHAHAKDFDKAQDFHLFDCIECGCCDYVCPAHIPLVQYYRYAKSEIWAQDTEKKASNVARERHEFRLYRLEREKQQRAARHKKKRVAIAPQGTEDKKKAAIQAAMERVRTKRQKGQATPKNVDGLTSGQQALIDEVDSRRRALAKDQGQNSHVPAKRSTSGEISGTGQRED